MNETWRFIVVITLLVAVGVLLPFAAEAAGPPIAASVAA